jgi:hypothetical protein
MQNLPYLIISAVLLGIGVVLIAWPLHLLRIFYRLPVILFPSRYSEDRLNPSVRDSLRLMRSDPNLYESRFSGKIKLLRFIGIFCLILFVLSLGKTCSLSG